MCLIYNMYKMEGKIKKRERCKNYIEEEKEHLMNLLQEHINVIENKRTDAITSKEKSKAWNSVAEKYNSLAKTGERSVIQLKLLYKSLKKLPKKHQADDKVETCKTEAGLFIPTIMNTDCKVLTMPRLQLNPHCNLYDSNTIQTTITIDDCETSSASTHSSIPSKTVSKKSFFNEVDKNKTVNEKEENPYAKELFEMKKERHIKKMEILEIIKQKELLDLKLKEREFLSKQ